MLFCRFEKASHWAVRIMRASAVRKYERVTNASAWHRQAISAMQGTGGRAPTSARPAPPVTLALLKASHIDGRGRRERAERETCAFRGSQGRARRIPFLPAGDVERAICAPAH